jgi:hypothetical protein
MSYLPDYAGALRCIGQFLHKHEIEAFEIKTHASEFRLLVGDPNPPYTALTKLQFSVQDLQILDREGQARRGRSTTEPTDIRFDSIPEVLRAIGDYVDHKHWDLRRLDNSSLSGTDIEIEYQTRTGDIRTENLATNFIRDICVRMYKRRTRLSNPISILTGKR